MLDRQACAAAVVGDDGGVGRVGGGGQGVDDRDALHAGQRRPGVGASAGDDDSVHPAVHEVLQMVLLPDGVAPGVAQQHGDLPRPERVLGAQQHRGTEAADAVRGHEADRPAAAAVQALGVLVGTESELRDRVQHSLPGLGPHASGAVERLGRRSDADASEGGDVGEPGPPGRRRVWSGRSHGQTFSWMSQTPDIVTGAAVLRQSGEKLNKHLT